MALLAFGDFVLDTVDKRVFRDQRPVEIATMPLAVLCHFIEHADDGRVVTKEELRKQVWRCKVEDVTIRSSLSAIREALGDTANRPAYLQTQGKEGWRLLVPVAARPTRDRSGPPPAPGGYYDPTHYVPRLSEENLLRGSLRNGRPAVVFGPPGSGKRMLIEHTLEHAAQGEQALLGRTLRVSVRTLAEPPGASLDALLRELGRLLLESSGQSIQDSRQALDAFWSPPILAKQKLRELVLHLLSPRTPGASELPTAIVLFDIDCLASCPFQDDVFNMLRAWQEDRFFGALRLVIETIIPPRLFPLGGQSPLWTKAQKIDVSRINLEQLRELAELHGVQATKPACERLGQLVGWNVYLGRIALFFAAIEGLSLEGSLTRYRPDEQELGPFAQHLDDLRTELDRLNATGAFPKPTEQLLQDATSSVSLTPQAAWRLMRKGLVAETETRNHFKISCPLYADYFGRKQP